MRNEEVIKAFIEGDEKAHTKNVFIKDNFLFSYGFHFPLAIRLIGTDGFKFVINKSKYSVSTSRHQGYLNRMINTDLKGNTEQLKRLMEKNIKTTDDFILNVLEENNEPRKD